MATSVPFVLTPDFPPPRSRQWPVASSFADSSPPVDRWSSSGRPPPSTSSPPSPLASSPAGATPLAGSGVAAGLAAGGWRQPVHRCGVTGPLARAFRRGQALASGPAGPWQPPGAGAPGFRSLSRGFWKLGLRGAQEAKRSERRQPFALRGARGRQPTGF